MSASAPKAHTHTNYRPDIDGLRALAVSLVVIFHAFPAHLPGGLIGVDVFFVISGYLITGIIFNSLENNRFSYLDFYSRRVRRIIPVLLLVLASAYVFGWATLYPDDYQTLGKHMAAASGFASNFVYMGEAGYFDAEAEAKPLLHLWSLAIEEQFYLLWPLSMVLIYKYLKNKTLHRNILLSALFFISFITCLYLSFSNPTAAYYFSFARFWELLFGAGLVFMQRRTNSQDLGKPQAIDQSPHLMSLAGAALLLVSLFLINKESVFPGYLALLPCLGTALLIASGKHAFVNRYILSFKPLVFLGLLSYSFYMWHWPVLYFTRNLFPNPSEFQSLAAVLLSLGFAGIGYFIYEQPIRRLSRHRSAIVLIALLLFFGLLGYNTFARDGLDFREVNSRPSIQQGLATARATTLAPATFDLKFSRHATDAAALLHMGSRLRNNRADYKVMEADANQINNKDLFCSSAKGHEQSSACPTQPIHSSAANAAPSVTALVIGDSHAGNFLDALQMAYPEVTFVPFIEGGCVPIAKRYVRADNLCGQMLSKAKQYVQQHPVALVILASRWLASFEEVGEDLDFYRVHAKKIALAGPSLMFDTDVHRLLSDLSPNDTDMNAFFASHVVADKLRLNQHMQAYASRQAIGYIDKIDLFCAEGFCPLISDGQLTIFDKGHVTRTGSKHVAQRLLQHHALPRLLSAQGRVVINSVTP
jgi:peptidoglycan/LPS O-acetylase OafA/YrhL